MSVFYTLSYRIGFHPWEDLAGHPPFADQLLSLVAREEHGVEPPYGRALDLGCGSAVWGVQLAQRGWQVTGVDNVGKALDRAEQRIRVAGVQMALIHGDVTRQGPPASERVTRRSRARTIQGLLATVG